ncbi:MAG: hypothetical protein GC161_01890 [Planctomycetaceae bacterium]|nr:hypothetical protein [Planctomycetaceae bacterium]
MPEAMALWFGPPVANSAWEQHCGELLGRLIAAQPEDRRVSVPPVQLHDSRSARAKFVLMRDDRGAICVSTHVVREWAHNDHQLAALLWMGLQLPVIELPDWQDWAKRRDPSGNTWLDRDVPLTWSAAVSLKGDDIREVTFKSSDLTSNSEGLPADVRRAVLVEVLHSCVQTGTAGGAAAICGDLEAGGVDLAQFVDLLDRAPPSSALPWTPALARNDRFREEVAEAAQKADESHIRFADAREAYLVRLQLLGP